MGRYVRCLLVCSGLLLAAAGASPDWRSVPLVNGHITAGDWSEFRFCHMRWAVGAPDHAFCTALTSCRDRRCLAAVRLSLYADETMHVLTPNTMAYRPGHGPPTSPPTHEVHRFLTRDPDLRPIMSEQLVTVARDIRNESFTYYLILSLANMIDPTGRTTGRIVALVPRGVDYDDAIDSAHGFCLDTIKRGCPPMQR